MKKSLITGIILVFACIGLTLYYEIGRDNYLSIHEITNKGLKDAKKNVYLDATFVAGSITNNRDYGFYVMFGDGVQYIVYMENNDAGMINKYLLDHPESSYRIRGITKMIPENLEENGIKFVKEWLDNNHNHESEEIKEHNHNITREEFYQYFGYVYLDSTINSYLIVKVLIYLTGLVGGVLIVNYLIKKFGLL